MGKESIENIINGTNAEIIFLKALDSIYKNGFKSMEDVEVVTYTKLYQPSLFAKHESKVLTTMGLFFKKLTIQPSTILEAVFDIYKKAVNSKFNSNFTPTQADIIDKIYGCKMFSFSSPTSTGKSHVFRKLISTFQNDIVIVVPSRALINEYRIKVNDIVDDKRTMVLTYVDLINKSNIDRHIFIITPERSKELFNLKDFLKISLIIFDEAQLSDETSFRGLYFDSIVRRCNKYFPNAKMLFAQPFVANPECQFVKNKIDYTVNNFATYDYQNVGQIFYCMDGNKFDHFSIVDGKKINTKVSDPIRETLINGGTVLIFSSKTKILDKRIMQVYQKYIDLCPPIVDEEALSLIKKYKEYLGATEKSSNAEVRHSTMAEYLKRGIVIHHGSLPLYARYIVEEFTQKGFCKICFATSTLEQGINMPFDLVLLDRFESSKPLAIKNLIGRAGRSTEKPLFDYGKIVVKESNRLALSRILRNKIVLSNTSQLDEETDDDNKEYKEAIKNGTFNETFNLTNTEIQRLEGVDTKEMVKTILSLFFDDDNKLSFWRRTPGERTIIRQNFANIYEKSLGRSLSEGERGVCREACKILVWKIMGKKFSEIVKYRYRSVCRYKEQQEIKALLKESTDSSEQDALHKELEDLRVDYAAPFYPLPDKKISRAPLYDLNTSVHDVDYDKLVLDTYDYLDKLLGFRFGDTIYAAFHKYYDEYHDIKALNMANYIKYGSADEKEIMMIRYGFDFEDFDWLKGIILKIDENEIIFDRSKVATLDDDKKVVIERFI